MKKWMLCGCRSCPGLKWFMLRFKCMLQDIYISDNDLKNLDYLHPDCPLPNLQTSVSTEQPRKADELRQLQREMDWLDNHCSFVADHPYILGPFKRGELRKLAQAGIAANIELTCGKCGHKRNGTSMDIHRTCSVPDCGGTLHDLMGEE